MTVIENLRLSHAAAQRLDLEERDFCGGAPVAMDLERREILQAALRMASVETGIMGARSGSRVVGGGKVLKEIRGMGKVYDWRESAWTPVNGGRFRPLMFTHHIPVIPNMQGIADFVRLRDVLVAQALMVQSATDREGNAALFTPFDFICFHARGANQLSTGCEHMHLTIGEDWTKRQLRAAAWLVQLAQRKHGIPTGNARMLRGNGVVRVVRKGQTTHRAVAEKAGFHDRSDPGPGYDREYVRHCVKFFDRHGHFEGA